ncbi:MAG: sigma-70 family RNA polymerase sigma factor [Verrucomicrobiales bacterium]|nr:sigma-70 family RNA polymerase sigma factor [Verrucomicrobiales bacterium]
MAKSARPTRPDPDSPDAAGEGEKKERVLWEKTRKSLIERLNNWEDQRTWNEFYQTYWRLIYSVATKSGLTREEAFDVVQETIIAIARQVQKGQYDPRAGSFKAWLLQMTRWRILDVFRARKRQPSLADRRQVETEDGADLTLERLTQEKDNLLESIWDREWRDNISSAALERVKSRVSPRQFQIFDCYVMKGWGVKKTAEALGINAAQVYLAKHRVGNLVKKEIRELEKQML